MARTPRTTDTTDTAGTAEGVGGASPPAGGRRGAGGRQGLILAGTLALGLGLGLGAMWLLTRGDGPAGADPSVAELNLPEATDPGPEGSDAEGSDAATGGDADPAPAPPPSDAPVSVADATSPEAAVSGFLTAEALTDFEASYAFLSAADREAYPTPAAWVAEHADLPPIAGFEVEEVRDDDAGTAVVTLTALKSQLNQILGLVPARARATWPVVEEDGGWRVAYRDSSLQLLYPSDEGAVDAVTAWVAARQRCATDGQYEGTLIGAPALSDALCDAAGEPVVGDVGVLTDGTQTTPLLDAFGPEVFTWARVVPVREPVAMDVVAAPIADGWQVVGVLPAE